jgi:hypothetical protein
LLVQYSARHQHDEDERRLRANGARLTPVVQSSGPVPARYRSEYSRVEAEVDGFATRAGAPPAHPSTVVGTELLAANGNIGAGLLGPQAISGVISQLEAFKALGVEGVTVNVSFPLLLSSTPDSSRYLSFYEQVAAQVRSRHMVLSVEENPVFSGTPLTSLSISYSGLTLASYAVEQREEAQVIIDDLSPSYLLLLTEPDTFSDMLNIDLDTPAAAVELVDDELDGLNRGRTEVGAGTGMWTTPAVDQALLSQTAIDYLDVHVYPLGPAQIDSLIADVGAADAAHKKLVMDETWLEKPTSTEGTGSQGAPDELKLNSYRFWEPLEERFVTAMVRYARSHAFAYVSFFDGARAFFGFLSWSAQLEAASYETFTRKCDQLVAGNMRRLYVLGTGIALSDAIRTR